MSSEASCALPQHKKKKETQALVVALSAKILTLEAQHKHMLALKTLQELVETCSLLLEELFKRARRLNVLYQRLFYEQRNKPGRLLARATQQRKLASMIHYIVDTSGKTHAKNGDIAQQFHCFYCNLYNLYSGETDPAVLSKC